MKTNVEKLTHDTLYVLVTCSKEETRHVCLEKTVKSLQDTQFLEVYRDNILVFDNDSTYANTLKFLKDNFRNVYKSNINVGYWSAIKWAVDNHVEIMGKKFKYIYPIESDCVYYDIEKLSYAEQFLDVCDLVGSVRCQEFSVSECHLYDKDIHTEKSRTHAWVRQTNYFTKEKVFFQKTDIPFVYLNNFVSLICCLNRMETMKLVFDELSMLDSFTELQFQAKFYQYYQLCGCIDGGVFTSLGNDGDTLSGSLFGNQTKQILSDAGYLPTRGSLNIVPPNEFVVTKLK
tara:strand:- start:17812 stop:18675 length:864 start_codon:yes stop_codon:yes gene_type:complete